MKGLSLPCSLLLGHHPIMPELLLQSAVVHIASPLLFFWCQAMLGFNVFLSTEVV